MIQDIRKRIFIVAGIVVLIIAIILFLLTRKHPVAPAPSNSVSPQANTAPVANNNGSTIIIKDVPPPPPANPEEREKLYAVQLAKIFVERYLSYSNQDNNGHITDVTTLATPKMISYIETQTAAYSRDYKGVSTKVISSSLKSFDKEKAVVTIGIQQILEEKEKNPTTAYKNGTVNLVKEEGTWKVDGLFFEE